MRQDVGDNFGRYRLLRPLSTDAVSSTWFATVTSPGTVASQDGEHFTIRILRPVAAGDERALDMARSALSAAQRAGAVDHPAIVRPHDLGILDGHPFVVTPFLRAVPLGDLLTHGGTITESAALSMFAQVAGGLDAAHRAGIVHAALSPRTIWVGPSSGEGAAYVAYVTGFGGAAALHDHLASQPRGPVLDDILYVAPEQVRGNRATAASDQYALACALWHTLAGRPPFQREDRAKLLGAHLLTAPPGLGDAGTAVSSAAVDAVRRGMAKHPDDRYPSCGELVHDALPSSSSSSSSAEQTRRATRPLGSGRRGARHERLRPVTATVSSAVRRRRWAPLTTAAIVVGLAGVLLWSLVRPMPAATSETAVTPSEPASAVGTGRVADPADAPVVDDAVAWSSSVLPRAVRTIAVAGGAAVASGVDGLAAVELDDGSTRWSADLPVEEVTFVGTVVVSAENSLQAVSLATGELQWRREGSMAPTRSLHAGDGVAVGLGDSAMASGVVAVGAGDGATIWRAPTPTPTQRSARMVAATAGAVTYVLDGVTLIATTVPDDAAVTSAQPDSAVAPTRWRETVDDPWPLLAADADAAVIATTAGQVCLYDADDGRLRWCEDVPGVDVEQPRLLLAGDAVVTTTSEVVAVLDGQSGAPVWSQAPGSPSNRVAAGEAAVAVSDGGGIVRLLDTTTGALIREVGDLGDVTALTVAGGDVYVGAADGTLTRIRLDVTAAP